MSEEEALKRLENEYRGLLSRTRANHHDTGGVFSRDYWKALKSGGHEMGWVVSRDDSGKLVARYDLRHAPPGLLTRYLSPIYGVFQPKSHTDLTHAVSKVHEAIEADEFNDHVLPVLKRHLGEGPPPTVDRGFMVQGHVNPAVVMRESNLLREIGDLPALDRLRKYRKGTDDIVLQHITGKVYGDEFTEEDFNKARAFYDSPVAS